MAVSPLNSVGGFSIGENLTVVILPNGDITTTNANFSGNVTASYFLGNGAFLTGIDAAGISNGTSNVKVYSNSNVAVSINGTSNVLVIDQTTLYSPNANISGNVIATGNISGNYILGNGAFLTGIDAAGISNGTSNVRVYNNGNVAFSIAGTSNVVIIDANTFYAPNANISGNLITANIVAPVGNITINATGIDGHVNLRPTGTGHVDVGNYRISSLSQPILAQDAATKEYVDSLAGEGLNIHTPVRVESPNSLNATYNQGGTTPTVDSISGNKTITFTASHGLSTNDGIVFTNSFNGIVGGEAYWVYSVPSSSSITIKNTYFGVEITTLTNGTSLSEPSRANPGVGATLINAGSNIALAIDNVSLANGDRVLVYTQANSAHNGVYVVSDIGNISAAWVLTRSTDMDKYIPDSTIGMSKGDYFFVSQGLTGAGESYVLTSPIDEIIIGTDNITFTQFSAAGAYTAGNGIDISGTVISANTDGVTTDIVGGNIVVKANAQLTTPNIGAATGTSLSITGNLDGNLVLANTVLLSNLSLLTSTTTTTTSISANQTIASYQITGTTYTAIEFIVKGLDSSGAKYSIATVMAVTNGITVDYSTYGTVDIGGTTGTLAVNIIVSGPNSNIALQVTPISSNSTVWTTQYRIV